MNNSGIFTKPTWIRPIASLLLPVYLVVSLPVPVQAQGRPVDSPRVTMIEPPRELLKPVRSRKGIKINKKQPKARPPSPELSFSAVPTDREITLAHVLPDALVPSGKTGAAENKALAKALLLQRKSVPAQDPAALQAFLQEHPHSAWRISLELNMGLVAYQKGLFSEAFTHWDSAWQLGKSSTDPAVKPQIDRAYGELLRMHARIGNMEPMKQLLAEAGDRSFSGSATELVANSKQGLWMMENMPGLSFRCGPLALASIVRHQQPALGLPQAVLDAASPQKGFALSEVADLAGKLKLDYQMAQWQDRENSVPPVPSVIHWKVGHYAALLKEEKGLWLVKDPTFGEDLWLSLEALKQEASGYFLVPRGKLPAGWTLVDKTEAAQVYGKGNTTTNDPDLPAPPDPEPPPPPCPVGMAQANAHLSVVSMNVRDIPLSYSPPKGPAIRFALQYNQREGNQPSVFNYSNLGPKWTYNWLSFVIDNPTTLSADVKIFTHAGGAHSFSGFDAGTQSFALEMKSQSILTRTSSTSYERTFKDGSKQIYDLSDGGTGAGRRVFLTEEIDPAGNSVTYGYDVSYRLVSVTDALGQVTTLEYDHPSDSLKITKVTDPFNREATLEYDSSGRLKKITDVIGITSEFTYGSNDFITSLTTPYGTETFAYGESGINRWLNLTDALGDTRRVEFRHEAPGVASTAPGTDTPAGISIYNSALQWRNVFYWDKKAWKMAPGDYSKAQVTHFLHQTSNITSGIVESTKKPYENRVWYAYPGQTAGVGAAYEGTGGQPSKIARELDDGTTQLSQYSYNAQGNLTEKIDPAGRSTEYVYDSNGIDLLEVRQTTGSIDELLATYTWNGDHRPLTVTDAAGETTTYTYNAAGQVLTVTNALSEVTTYDYDADGYLESIDGPVSGTGDSVSLTYDAVGRIRTVTDTEGYTLTYDYDDFDRVTLITFPDTTTRQIIYNKLDAEWVKDREGRWTRTFHNKIRQVAAVQDALGRLTNYEWCKCGSLQGLTDAMGRETRWSYDEQGRLLEKTYPDNTTLTYAYENTTSRLKSVTDALNQRTNYEYFVDNQLKETNYTDGSGSALSPPTPTVEFTYDTDYGRLASMSDGIGTTTYAYHPITGSPSLGAGRLAQVDGPLGNDLIAYAYDELGRLSGKAINSVAETYEYDVLGRVIEVANPLGTFDYTYVNHTGRLATVAYPNGQTTEFDYYNNAGDQRLQQIKHETSAPALLSQFDYEYSATGSIKKWTQALGAATPQAWSITQDPVDQLTNIQVRESSTLVKDYAYTYDKAGNRLTEQVDGSVTTSTHNNLNQLTSQSAGGWMKFTGTLSEPATVTVDGNPAYVDGDNNFTGYAEVGTGSNTVPVVATDASSNVKTNNYSVTVSGGSRTLAYDLNGNMTNNGDGQTYTWDAANRLTKITYTGNATTEFSYDGYGRRVRIHEKDSGSSTITDKKYLWCDGNQPCEERNSAGSTVVKHFYLQGVYVPGASSPADKLFYTKDHLGSIRELTDDNETVLARYSYDAWGRRTKLSGAGEADLGFTGHFEHATSGLTLTWYRAYDSELGRWINRDPIQEQDSENLFQYVGRNPLRFFDSYGLFASCSDPVWDGTISLDSDTREQDIEVGPWEYIGRRFGGGTWAETLSQHIVVWDDYQQAMLKIVETTIIEYFNTKMICINKCGAVSIVRGVDVAWDVVLTLTPWTRKFSVPVEIQDHSLPELNTKITPPSGQKNQKNSSISQGSGGYTAPKKNDNFWKKNLKK